MSAAIPSFSSPESKNLLRKSSQDSGIVKTVHRLAYSLKELAVLEQVKFHTQKAALRFTDLKTLIYHTF